MFKEALDLVFQKAQALADANAALAIKPKLFTIPQEPSHVYYLDGKRIEAPPPARNHTALGLDTIIEFAKSSETARVWYSWSNIVCVIDDSTRRDNVVLDLSLSPQVAAIESWGERSKPLSQRDLVLLLRVMFRDCLAKSPSLLEIIRSLRFTTGSDTATEIAKNKSSMTRQQEAKVTGQAEVPDEFYLTVPIFTGEFRSMDGVVCVALEVSPAEEKFTLIPIPGMLDEQIDNAVGVIRDKLTAALGEGKVSYGTP